MYTLFIQRATYFAASLVPLKERYEIAKNLHLSLLNRYWRNIKMATNEAYTLEIESAKLNENQLKMTIEVIADFESLISSNYSRSNREDVMLSVQRIL